MYDEFLKEGYTVEQALKQGSFQAKDRKLFLRTLDYFLDVPLPTTVYSNRDYTNPLLDNLPQNRNLLKSQVFINITYLFLREHMFYLLKILIIAFLTCNND